MNNTADVIDISTRLNAALAEPAATPGPGVYPGTPMDVYHRWSAASNSRLSRLRRSPAHLKAYLSQPPEDTVALRVGRAIHTAILEPDDFAARYFRGPIGDRRTKAVKETWETLESQHGEGYVLKDAEYQCCLSIRDSVHAHPRAHAMLSGAGQVELSMLWRDEESGVLCKARHDRHSPEIVGGVIVDVKSTRDASRREFERSIFSLGYHRQGALYLRAARTLELPAEHYCILAVEKEPPFACALYRLTEGAIDAGWDECRLLLKLYARCLERDEWPGYSEDVQDIALPAFAWSQIDEDTRERETA